MAGGGKRKAPSASASTSASASPAEGPSKRSRTGETSGAGRGKTNASPASRPRARPVGKAATNRAATTSTSRKRAVTPEDSPYEESEDELDERTVRELDEEGSDGSWMGEDEDAGAAKKKKGKGKQKASPAKNNSRGKGAAGRGGAAARGRAAAISAAAGPSSAPQRKARKRPEIGSETDPMEQLCDADDDLSLASWNEHDRDEWQEASSKDQSESLQVGHILRFRKHPRRGYGQYRVYWNGQSLYSSSWETEWTFNAAANGTDNPEITQADIFWASAPGGRPPDVPRAVGGDPPDPSYSDTDVQDYIGLQSLQIRDKRQRLRDAWRRDKYQLRKLRRGHQDAAMRAAQAAAHAAGEPIPIIDSDAEEELMGEVDEALKMRRSPQKGGAAGGKAAKSPKRGGGRASTNGGGAVSFEPEPMLTRSGSGRGGKAGAGRTTSASPAKNQAPPRAGPASRVGAGAASVSAGTSKGATRASAPTSAPASAAASSSAPRSKVGPASRVLPLFRQPDSKPDVIVISDSDEEKDRKPAMRTAAPAAASQGANASSQSTTAAPAAPSTSRNPPVDVKKPPPAASPVKQARPVPVQPEAIPAVDSPTTRALRTSAAQAAARHEAEQSAAGPSTSRLPVPPKTEDDALSALFREVAGGDEQEHSPNLMIALQMARNLAAEQVRAEAEANTANGAAATVLAQPGVAATAATTSVATSSIAASGVASSGSAVPVNGTNVSSASTGQVAPSVTTQPIPSGAVPALTQQDAAATSTESIQTDTPAASQAQSQQVTASVQADAQPPKAKVEVKMERLPSSDAHVPSSASQPSRPVPEPSQVASEQQDTKPVLDRNGNVSTQPSEEFLPMSAPAAPTTAPTPRLEGEGATVPHPVIAAEAAPAPAQVSTSAPTPASEPTLTQEPELKPEAAAVASAGSFMLELSPEPEGGEEDDEMGDIVVLEGFALGQTLDTPQAQASTEPVLRIGTLAGGDVSMQDATQEPLQPPTSTAEAPPIVPMPTDSDHGQEQQDDEDLWGGDEGSEAEADMLLGEADAGADTTAATGQPDANSAGPQAGADASVQPLGPGASTLNQAGVEAQSAAASIPAVVAPVSTESASDAGGSQEVEGTGGSSSSNAGHRNKAAGITLIDEDTELQKFMPKVASVASAGPAPRRPRSIPGAAAMSSRIGMGPPPKPIPSRPGTTGSATPYRGASGPGSVVSQGGGGQTPAAWQDSGTDSWGDAVSSANPAGPTAAGSMPAPAWPASQPAVDEAQRFEIAASGWDDDEPPAVPPAAPMPSAAAPQAQVQRPPARIQQAPPAPAPQAVNEYQRFDDAAAGWGDDDSGLPAPSASVPQPSGLRPTQTMAAPPLDEASRFEAAAAGWGDEDDQPAAPAQSGFGGQQSQWSASGIEPGGWGDPNNAVNRNASWGNDSGGSRPGPSQQQGQPQHQQMLSHLQQQPPQQQDTRGQAPRRSSSGNDAGRGWNNPPGRSPNPAYGGWGAGGGAGQNASHSNWDQGVPERRASGGSWGNDGGQGGDAGGGGGGSWGGRGGHRGGFRGGRGGGYQGNTGRTPPGAGGSNWGAGGAGGGGSTWGGGFSNGGRTPGYSNQNAGAKTPMDHSQGHNAGGRTPGGWGGGGGGSGRTTPGNRSSGGRTPGGPSNWAGDGPGESVAMNLSMDAGHAPQQFVSQAPPMVAGPHMPGSAPVPVPVPVQMQMQMQMQQQQQMMAQMVVQPAPVDYRSMMSPYQQKRFDKWFNESQSGDKMNIAHDATRAVLQFEVNDDLIKKLQSSYAFIFREKGGTETKLAHAMVKVAKGGMRAELSFEDDAFWTKDSLVLIWRHVADKLLTNTRPDALAPFLNKAKRHKRLTFMVFGSEHPEVNCKRNFEVVLPWSKKGGTLSPSLSGLLHHAYHADTKEKDKAPPTLPLWKLVAKPPKNWQVVLHPWLIAVIRLCAEEQQQKELFAAVGFDFPVDPRWLKELPARLEKKTKEMDDADTKCGYDADLPEHESIADLVKAVDRELLASMHKVQVNHWTEERFTVILSEGGSLHKLEEEVKAGVEVLRMDELRSFWSLLSK
ncbi:hypothetical protein OC842_004185 [Tilletia horrida]|uniref:Chromo domain-containing protein n=1 Tax=Tilletia horrida TaxID=155126 RepID=A0AAN6GBJ5_9BASI|nr:hypothetical protein OC842_004185 [Tilletia horrida]